MFARGSLTLEIATPVFSMETFIDLLFGGNLTVDGYDVGISCFSEVKASALFNTMNEHHGVPREHQQWT